MADTQSIENWVLQVAPAGSPRKPQDGIERDDGMLPASTPSSRVSVTGSERTESSATDKQANSCHETPLCVLEEYGVYRVGVPTKTTNALSPTDAMKDLKDRILAADQTAMDRPQATLSQYYASAARIGYWMDQTVGKGSTKPQVDALTAVLSGCPDTCGVDIFNVEGLPISPQYRLVSPSREPLHLCPDAVISVPTGDRANRVNKFFTATKHRYSLCPLPRLEYMSALLLHAIQFRMFSEDPIGPIRQCLGYIGASLRMFAELAEKAGIDLTQDPIPACVAMEYRFCMWHFTVVALHEDKSHGKVILFEEIPRVDLNPRRPDDLCSLTEVFKAIAIHANEVWWSWVERLMDNLDQGRPTEGQA
ncbi:hypothetical protein P170DRAFT_62655 [Aspergillus steynii IBT 23096]|uniref:Uncharacterized protein n=1 Tax=Aspergillus steynii IBT 23096 TaxID=1392250 RepID=A0A2I2FT62_9EURO|nr:uncharacterized protein P170DRAFT_62655 [Aspergillus steynii IBT 23096]PLB43804.1 hypothetical protein P170DRAFT_62655 [Aspergillus steynii IBT 23096]